MPLAPCVPVVCENSPATGAPHAWDVRAAGARIAPSSSHLLALPRLPLDEETGRDASAVAAARTGGPSAAPLATGRSPRILARNVRIALPALPKRTESSP